MLMLSQANAKQHKLCSKLHIKARKEVSKEVEFEKDLYFVPIRKCQLDDKGIRLYNFK